MLEGPNATETGFANRVEALLALGFAGESAEAIAMRLEINPRTLARRLSAEGTSFQTIRDQVRRGWRRAICG